MGSRDQHVQVEGLAQVVVRAVGQSFDGRRRIVQRRQDQDRPAEPVPTRPPADLEAVAVRQAPVEHEEVVVVDREELFGLRDSRGLVAGKPGAC